MPNADKPGEERLAELARQINSEHRERQQDEGTATLHQASAYRHAVRAGELLVEARALVEGGWLAWLEGNFEGSRRTAYDYIDLAENQDLDELQSSATPSISGALRIVREARGTLGSRAPSPPGTETPAADLEDGSEDFDAWASDPGEADPGDASEVLEEEAPEQSPAPPPSARATGGTPAASRPTPAREGGVKRPIFPYAGSKWNLAPRIVEMFPPHRVYLEPFLGSAAVFLTKAPSGREVLNDVNREVVNAFEMVRARPEELAEEVTLTLNARDEFEAARNAYEAGGWEDRDDLERARMWFVLAYQGHRRQARGRVFKVSTHPTGPDLAGLWKRLPAKIAPTAARLKDAVIENRPALEVIEEHGHGDALIYADPPYVLGSLRSGELYEHGMTDAEHEALLETLRGHPGPVFLSGYDSDLYRDLLRDWELRELTEVDGEGVELLRLNEPAAAGARAADRSARDRERKARAHGRISAPPRTLAPPEEAAIFGALLEGWRTEE